MKDRKIRKYEMTCDKNISIAWEIINLSYTVYI